MLEDLSFDQWRGQSKVRCCANLDKCLDRVLTFSQGRTISAARFKGAHIDNAYFAADHSILF